MEFGFRADFQLRWLWDQQQAKPQDFRRLGLRPIPGPRCVLGGGWEVWGEGGCGTCREPLLRCFLWLVLQVHAHTPPLPRAPESPDGRPATSSCGAPATGTAAVGALHRGREPPGCPCVPSREAAGGTGTAQGRPLTSEREHSLGHLAGLAGNCPPGRGMGTAADTGRRGGPR